MPRKNGGFVVGLIAVNAERTSYEQHLTIFDSSWLKTAEIITPRSGYDMAWSSVELSDGHIVNGVKETIQLISPDNQILSTYKLPNVQAGMNYQAVDGDPVI